MSDSKENEREFFFADEEELETIKFISEEEAGIFDEKIETVEPPKPIQKPQRYETQIVDSWAPKGKRKLIKNFELPFSPVRAFFVLGGISLLVGVGFVLYTVTKIVL